MGCLNQLIAGGPHIVGVDPSISFHINISIIASKEPVSKSQHISAHGEFILLFVQHLHFFGGESTRGKRMKPKKHPTHWRFSGSIFVGGYVQHVDA